MDLGPLLPGRIPGTLVTERLRSNIAAGQRELTRMQEQVATGQRYFLPSEDPGSAVRSISLKKLLTRKTQALTNINSDQALLSATETSLTTISDALNKAKQLITAGIGDSVSSAERKGLAIEAEGVLQGLLNAGNTTFRGRRLFAGSENGQAPFTGLAENAVRYEGDVFSIDSFVDIGLLQSNNTDGATAFGALTPSQGRDVNPALGLNTRIEDLYGGTGVRLGQISVSLSAAPPVQTVDLSGAQTIGDLKAILENAFPGGLTVAVNGTNNGLSITPTAGTVTIADINGGFVAADLGIRATAAATVTGGDLDPRLTIKSTLASLNGGTGIGATAGNGLRIVNGSITKDVDISTATTVEDLLNLLRDPALALSAEVAADGKSLDIRSRLSGANFSIGEHGGTNATLLGLRTTIASTELSDFNFGRGVPVDNGQKLNVTRRDGTVSQIDLAGSVTVQDVLTKINAVSPGNLVASLVPNGNGLQITDNSGTGPLSIEQNEISLALALNGSETGAVNTVPLVGRDPNFQEATGSLNIVLRLKDALERSDSVELTRLNSLVDKEIGRVTQLRGELGGRLKSLDDAQNRLQDNQVEIQKALSTEFDADLSEVLTRIVTLQTTLEATLKVASQTLQVSLVNFL
jgi:flagellar hook-associated protein 3 FlgL